MLEHIQREQNGSPTRPVVDAEQVAGLEVHEAAALDMSEFQKLVQTCREASIFSPNRYRLQGRQAAIYAQRASLAKGGEPGN